MATEKQRKQFGEALRTARIEDGLSQSDVAKALSKVVASVTPAAVGNWERGENEPRRDYVKELESLLDCRGKLSPLLGYTLRRPTRPRPNREAANTLEGLAESLDGFARELSVLSQTVRRLARGAP